jgi:hypothetical protein
VQAAIDENAAALSNTNGRLQDVKADMSDITGNTVVEMTMGKYIATNGETANINTIATDANYAYAVLDCAEGDAFTITGHGGVTPRLYAFLGAETNGARPVLVKANSAMELANAYITAPTGAEKVVFNVNVNYEFYVVVGKSIVNAWAEIDETKTEISKIKKVVVFPNMADPSKFQQGYKTDTGYTHASPTYMFTAIMPVSEGDVLHIIPKGRYLCAYDMNGAVVSNAGLSAEYTEYTVPSGIGSVTVTFFAVNKDELMVTKYAGQEYIPYGEPVISEEYLPEHDDITALQYLAQYDKSNFFKEKGDLAAGQHLLIDKFLSVKKNVVISFSGNIDGEFEGVDIGFTGNITASDVRHFQITPTELKRITASPATQNHGISISGNLSITFELLFDEKLKITISSGGASATFTYVWVAGYEKPYIKALSNMTDCVLSYTCKDLSKETAIFGDSYLSYGQNRWTYYLIDNNQIDNVLINAFAG